MLSLGRENFQFEACAIVHDMILWYRPNSYAKHIIEKKEREENQLSTPTISKLA